MFSLQLQLAILSLLPSALQTFRACIWPVVHYIWEYAKYKIDLAVEKRVASRRKMGWLPGWGSPQEFLLELQEGRLGLENCCAPRAASLRTRICSVQ